MPKRSRRSTSGLATRQTTSTRCPSRPEGRAPRPCAGRRKVGACCLRPGNWQHASMPTLPSLPSRKDLFVNTLKVHQAVYERTHGLIGHRILLGMPALMLRTTGRRSGIDPHERARLRQGRRPADGRRLQRRPSQAPGLAAQPRVEPRGRGAGGPAPLAGHRRTPCVRETRSTTGCSRSATAPTGASSRRTRRSPTGRSRWSCSPAADHPAERIRWPAVRARPAPPAS